MHFNNTSFGILPYVKQVVWLTLVTAIVALAVVCVRLFSLVHFNADINIVNADFWRVLWQGLRLMWPRLFVCFFQFTCCLCLQCCCQRLWDDARRIVP